MHKSDRSKAENSSISKLSSEVLDVESVPIIELPLSSSKFSSVSDTAHEKFPVPLISNWMEPEQKQSDKRTSEKATLSSQQTTETSKVYSSANTSTIHVQPAKSPELKLDERSRTPQKVTKTNTPEENFTFLERHEHSSPTSSLSPSEYSASQDKLDQSERILLSSGSPVSQEDRGVSSKLTPVESPKPLGRKDLVKSPELKLHERLHTPQQVSETTTPEENRTALERHEQSSPTSSLSPSKYSISQDTVDQNERILLSSVSPISQEDRYGPFRLTPIESPKPLGRRDLGSPKFVAGESSISFRDKFQKYGSEISSEKSSSYINRNQDSSILQLTGTKSQEKRDYNSPTLTLNAFQQNEVESLSKVTQQPAFISIEMVDNKLHPTQNTEKPTTVDNKLHPLQNTEKPSTVDNKLHPLQNTEKFSKVDNKLHPIQKTENPFTVNKKLHPIQKTEKSSTSSKTESSRHASMSSQESDPTSKSDLRPYDTRSTISADSRKLKRLSPGHANSFSGRDRNFDTRLSDSSNFSDNLFLQQQGQQSGTIIDMLLKNRLASKQDSLTGTKTDSMKNVVASESKMSSLTGNLDSMLLSSNRLDLLRRLANFYVAQDKFVIDEDHAAFIQSVRLKAMFETPEPILASIKREVFPILLVSSYRGILYFTI